MTASEILNFLNSNNYRVKLFSSDLTDGEKGRNDLTGWKKMIGYCAPNSNVWYWLSALGDNTFSHCEVYSQNNGRSKQGPVRMIKANMSLRSKIEKHLAGTK